jgi:hypothetical protein
VRPHIQYYIKLLILSIIKLQKIFRNKKLRKSELISKKLSLSCFCLVGLSDLSGNASLNLNYQIDKNCSLSLGPSYIFGKENTEFTRATKDMLMFNISVKLGGGKF